MISSSTRMAVLTAALLLAGAKLALAQDAPKTIKKAPAPMTSPASGKEMFDTYCAVCHGTAGRGDGPAASEFKIAPANLSLLAANNNGKFPSNHVAETILVGPRDSKAHGSQDMPVWGKVFAVMGDKAQVDQRVHNLTAYIETLQAK